MNLPDPVSAPQFESWSRRRVPASEEVRDGVWSISVPLPASAGMPYVNCYVFAGSGPLTVVDPGWADDATWNALAGEMSSLGLRLRDVEQVLVTHFHPDHYGLAPRVRAHSGAQVRMHALDADIYRRAPHRDDDTVIRIADFLRWCGAPEDEVGSLSNERSLIERLREAGNPDEDLVPGETVAAGDTTLEVIWTPGHSPGHVCLFDGPNRLLLTGDHVLAKISPNVAVYDRMAANPLGDFLASLAKLDDIAAEEVLPAHEYRFLDLKARLAQLAGHHDGRFGEVAGILHDHGPSTAWSIAELLTWSRPWADMPSYARRSANGEALAHLRELEARGHVQSSDAEIQVWTARVVGERTQATLG
jgi:glyoxylase-like metal-dependent hydrolase (beta-lactamase superfamily II)